MNNSSSERHITDIRNAHSLRVYFYGTSMLNECNPDVFFLCLVLSWAEKTK